MTQVMIRDEFAYDCSGHSAMAAFARACTRENIPTGIGIPAEAASLAKEAHFTGKPELWEAARKALELEPTLMDQVMKDLFGVERRS